VKFACKTLIAFLALLAFLAQGCIATMTAIGEPRVVGTQKQTEKLKDGKAHKIEMELQSDGILLKIVEGPACRDIQYRIARKPIFGKGKKGDIAFLGKNAKWTTGNKYVDYIVGVPAAVLVFVEFIPLGIGFSYFPGEYDPESDSEIDKDTDADDASMAAVFLVVGVVIVGADYLIAKGISKIPFRKDIKPTGYPYPCSESTTVEPIDISVELTTQPLVWKKVLELDNGVGKILYSELHSEIFSYEEIKFFAKANYKGKEISGVLVAKGRDLSFHYFDMGSFGMVVANPRPVVTYRWDRETVRAGETAKLYIKVVNEGEGILYQLVAVAHSHSTFIGSKRAEFGRINPGESREHIMLFKIPETWAGDKINIKIEFEEYNKNAPRGFTTQLKISPAN